MVAQNNFPLSSRSREAPPNRWVSVTPHDTNDLAFVTNGLWIGGAGNVAVVTAKGDDVVLYGVAAGQQIVGEFVKVKSTGTTATNILATGNE